MNQILVSIIIPTYGRPNFLGRAIESVLKQSYKDFELIVIDDNQPLSENRNETARLMERYSSDARVIYVKHTENKRVAAARNTGLKIARGEFVTFLDDDDEYCEFKLEKQVDILISKPEFNGCYCRFESYSNGRLTRRSSYAKEGDLSHDVYMFRCTGNASCYMFRRSTLVELKGFNEMLPRHEDFELLVRFFEKNLMAFSDYCGVLRHTDSRINMPSLGQYIEIKTAFLNSVSQNLSACPDKEIKKITKTHKADVFFYALRKKEFLKSLSLFPGFFSSLRYLYIKVPNIVEILKRKACI